MEVGLLFLLFVFELFYLVFQLDVLLLQLVVPLVLAGQRLLLAGVAEVVSYHHLLDYGLHLKVRHLRQLHTFKLTN